MLFEVSCPASDSKSSVCRRGHRIYKDGLDNYLNVAVAQVQSLATQLTEVQIRVREIPAAVSLIRALGGGWTVQELPDEKQTLKFTEADYAVSDRKSPPAAVVFSDSRTRIDSQATTWPG